MLRFARERTIGALVAASFVFVSLPQPADANSKLENAIYRAVVKGRQTKKVKHRGHQFNIKPVHVDRNVAGFVVKGRLSHHLRFRKDDQVNYTIDIRHDGTVRNLTTKINRGGITKTLMTLKVGEIIKHTTKKKKTTVTIDKKTADNIIKKAGRWIGKKVDGKWERAAEEVIVLIGAQVALTYGR